MQKKRIYIVLILIVAMLITSYWVGTGFRKRNDVMLLDYSVSEDGTEMALHVEEFSSMGYIRGFKNNGGGVKPHYLTFYAAFGGVNSSFGSANTFMLELDQNDTEIYFNRAGGGYELVLQKNEETGEWIRPGQTKEAIGADKLEESMSERNIYKLSFEEVISYEKNICCYFNIYDKLHGRLWS